MSITLTSDSDIAVSSLPQASTLRSLVLTQVRHAYTMTDQTNSMMATEVTPGAVLPVGTPTSPASLSPMVEVDRTCTSETTDIHHTQSAGQFFHRIALCLIETKTSKKEWVLTARRNATHSDCDVRFQNLVYDPGIVSGWYTVTEMQFSGPSKLLERNKLVAQKCVPVSGSRSRIEDLITLGTMNSPNLGRSATAATISHQLERGENDIGLHCQYGPLARPDNRSYKGRLLSP